MIAALIAQLPVLDGCIRSHPLPPADQRRVEVDGTWGTVTSVAMLGPMVTGCRVVFDCGAARTVAPDTIMLGPPPAGRPALVCLPGGLA